MAAIEGTEKFEAIKLEVVPVNAKLYKLPV
jgi:hypothetical protein